MEYEKLLSRYSYAELRIQKSIDTSIRINNEEVKTVSGNSFGLSVRVLENGSWGFASGDKLSDLENLLITAKRLALLSSGKIKLSENDDFSSQKVRKKHDQFDIDRKIKELLSVSNELSDGKIISRSISFTD